MERNKNGGKLNSLPPFSGLSRKSMGISKKVCNTEKEELPVGNASEISPEKFYFSVERLDHGVRRTVVVEVKNLIVMFVEFCVNNVE